MMKVLVVEDNPLNMELMIDILDPQGFTVHEAINGKEAIKKTEEKIYDLIFMDIALPDIGGVELIRIIKRKPEYKDIPVIAITAFAMKGDKEKLLCGGFDDYIPKPIDVPEFTKKIQKYRELMTYVT